MGNGWWYSALDWRYVHDLRPLLCTSLRTEVLFAAIEYTYKDISTFEVVKNTNYRATATL
jgi:hypothetical protein